MIERATSKPSASLTKSRFGLDVPLPRRGGGLEDVATTRALITGHSVDEVRDALESKRDDAMAELNAKAAALEADTQALLDRCAETTRQSQADRERREAEDAAHLAEVSE